MGASRFFRSIGLAPGLGLAACGGGGSAGSSPIAAVEPVASAVVKTASLALSLVDGSGTLVANRGLSQTESRYLRMVLTGSSGPAVPYKRVTVTLDSSNARLFPASGVDLTDAVGVLLMRIAPTSVTAAGLVQVTAAATVAGVAVTQTLGLQIAAGTVTLMGMSALPARVKNGQAVNVAVNVLVNGAPAASNALALVFTSDCGTVSPASSLVDGNGLATGVIQTANVGNCFVLATAAGGATSRAAFEVEPPPMTGIRFVSATPSVIYQAGSAGTHMSLVSFKVVNSVGAAVPGENVTASLANTDGGINFCGSPSVGTSGAHGLVTFSVCAGTLPATVQVQATLDSGITTNSNRLAIHIGVASQRSFELSASKLNFYAGDQFTSQFTGDSVDITANVAGRQGNPVPDGTNVMFVAESRQINSSGQSSCVLSAGSCTARLIGQAYRPLGSSAFNGDPRPGRVTVLAYADGEEYFSDANNNNSYDSGELFEDLGLPYLDKDESRAFVSAYTNLVAGTDDGETSYPLPSGACSATLEGSIVGSTIEPTQHTLTLRICAAGDMVRFTATVSGRVSSLSVVLP